MKAIDTLQAYAQVRANGWSHRDAVKTAGIIFDAGGFSGLGGAGSSNYWPNSFRKLTDSWPERVGFDPTAVNLEQFWRNSTVQSCIGFIQRTFPEARLRVLEGEGDAAKEVRGHPLTRLLNRPNKHYSSQRMWQVTLCDWWIWGRGNAYWKKVKDQTGTPIELWPILASHMEPRWPPDGSVWISHYDRTVNGAVQQLQPEEVIHFRFGQDPLNNRKGYSPLLSGQGEVGVLNEGAVYRGALMQNHGLPSYVMAPVDEAAAKTMTKEKAEGLELLWRTKFTGRGRGGLFIPNFSAKLERAGFSPQELDIRELMEWDADILCALFGLSSMVLGLPSGEKHRTFANMGEAREAAMESNICPTQALFAADIEAQLLPDFDQAPDRHVGWDYSQVRVLQEDQSKLWTRLGAAVGGPWLAPDEARKVVNHTPIAGGDKLYPPKSGAALPSEEDPNPSPEVPAPAPAN